MPLYRSQNMSKFYPTNLDDELYYACRRGDIDAVRAIIINRDGTITTKHVNYELAFYGACESGNTDIVEWILYLGDTANININAGFKIACEKGHIDLVSILKEDYCADDYNSGLYDAALKGHIKVVLLLLSYGAFIYDGGLFASCAGGYPKIASIMINMGAKDWGRCFGVACLSGHVSIVKLILLHGKSMCNINDGLIKAYSRGRFNVVIYLLNEGLCSEWKWASEIPKLEGHDSLLDYILTYSYGAQYFRSECIS